MRALRYVRRLARLAAMGLGLCLGPGFAAPAQADTDLALIASFDGRVNFTGTQVTLRNKANGKDACAVAAATSNRNATLQLPYGATVLSAQLYWAGSGAPDSTVTFEGKSYTAARRYTSATVGGGLNYFGGVADVTAAVKAVGSGKYSFSGLTVSIGDPWCSSQAVLGGFSLLVVYSHPLEPERVLNLYEGFRHVHNSEVTLTANNFRWPSPAYPVKERARVGHITWEGDGTLAQGGERLLFSGTEMTDSRNPEGNQFNSRSNINGDDASYGVDFDAYDTTVTIWAGYEASVTTSYRTGQDLVLLNAEILVLPTMPVSDLSIAMSRSGVLKTGQTWTYAVTVANNGPYTEAGPVTVSTTLPSGLGFVSGSGSNWSCAAAGQLVTCTWSGTGFVPGTQLPGLAINAAVTTSGEKTVKAVVKGTDDDKAANNEATVTATALQDTVTEPPPPGPGGVAKYVVTAKACAANAAVGPDGDCPYFTGPVSGGAKTGLFVTAVDGGGKAMAAPPSVAMKFALRCINPRDTAGVQARVGTRDLPACAANLPNAQPALSWSEEASVAFAAGAASAPLIFSYADVGKVELHLAAGGSAGTPAVFVSRPAAIAFRSVTRNGVPAPADTSPAGPGFAMAGEPVQVAIGALVSDAAGSLVNAPNFGREDAVPAPRLVNAPMYTDAGRSDHLAAQVGLTVDAAWQKGAAGTVTAGASWGEVGSTTFVATLDDYLGSGAVAGEARRNVGRFYPAYFSTVIDEPFACPAGLACTARDNTPLGIAYSGQPFTARVVPHNVDDQALSNFKGDWFRPVSLSMTAADGSAPVGSLAPAALAGSGDASLRYTLPNAFNADARLAAGVTAPTTVYLRARAENSRVTAAGSEPAPILSDRSPAASSEDGLVVLNGRLRVANALGTDVLRTPLGLRVEFWNGARWQAHGGYADGSGVSAALANFSDCTRTLAGTGTPCNPDLVGVSAGQTVRLANGAGVLWLRAPGKQADGKSRDGSIGVRFPGWAWLPSTAARVTFGRHRSPVIYMRELY